MLFEAWVQGLNLVTAFRKPLGSSKVDLEGVFFFVDMVQLSWLEFLTFPLHGHSEILSHLERKLRK